MSDNLPKVTIIGRVNVGKSTLFNKLVEKRQAMMSDIPGTTRDLNIGTAEWQGVKFELADTGGFLPTAKKLETRNLPAGKSGNRFEIQDNIDEKVRLKAMEAFNKADLALFMVDVKEGLNPQDKEIAKFLNKSDKKFLLVVNKCDSPKLREQVAEFYKLGLEEPILVSAANGSGTGDLLDAIIKQLTINNQQPTKSKESDTETGELNSESDKSTPQDGLIRVSIIGKPNVGKSSLINKLTGEEKFIVSPTAHTTREPNDTLLEYKGNKILLIDTAGIRKKRKIDPKSLEKLGVMMSIGSLKKSDIVLLEIDISKRLTDQDANLGRLIAESNAGVIIVANKYDLIKESKIKQYTEESKDPAKELKKYINILMPHLSWAPIIFVSALTGLNVKKILQLILEIQKNREKQVNENALSRFLKSIIKKQPPPKLRTEKRRAFITDFEQVGTCPPVFLGNITTQETLPQAYRRYVEKSLRDKFGFEGTPIKLVIKHKKVRG